MSIDTHPASDRRTARQRSGDAAEAAAARFLVSQGLPALQRHFVRRVGEIDLIHIEPASGTVVFVEVRYRRSSAYGGALGSVGVRKRRALQRVVRAWLQAHADRRRPARIDVIGMTCSSPSTALELTWAEPSWRSWEDYRLCWIENALTDQLAT